MFDYVKMWAYNGLLVQKFLKRKDLVFRTYIDQRTKKKLAESYEAEYYNLKIKVDYNGRIEISGSLHIFYNLLTGKENHNYNLFSYDNLLHTIDHLSNYLEIDQKEMKISRIEYGYNISPLFPITDFLNSLIVIKGKQFNIMKTIGPGDGRECFNSEHGYKIYNKGLQYGMNNILRFERKTIKMRSIFSRNIYLGDLRDKRLWAKLHQDLIKSLDDIIIDEQIENDTRLSKYDKMLLIECRNPISWKKFNTVQRAHRKKRFNMLMRDYGILKYKPQLKNLFETAFNEMLKL